MDTVWVLIIEHRHGSNIYVNKTKDGAAGELFSYVSEWWDEVRGRGRWGVNDPGDIPADRDEAIETYFEVVSDEFYTLEQCHVGS